MADNRVRIRVRVDDDTVQGFNRVRQTTRNLGRRLADDFRHIGSDAGNGLMQALQGNISGGFSTLASNPYIAAGIAALAVAAASAIGAAIAGALVLAIGGAFVALGAFIAFQADGVKEKWAKTLSDLKPLFVDAASGLQPVLEHYRVMFGDLAKDFAPHFKQALNAAAPHVQTFIDHIVEGFKELGRRAAPDLEEAFNVFLDALGPMFEDALAGLGDSLAALARTVRDHSTEIAAVFTIIVGAITITIDIVNFFANVWVRAFDASFDAIGTLIGGVANLLDIVLGAFGGILNGAEEAFGWIPGVGSQLETAKKNFGIWREKTVSDMRAASESFKGAGEELDRTNRRRVLDVNIASWKNQLKIARADLKKTSDQKAQAKLRADISDLQAKIKRARGDLNALNGKTVTTFVRTAYYQGAPGPYAPKAHGGMVGAAATGGVRSNMTLVGEHGPELVDLAPGSRVRSNPDSRRLASQGGGNSGTATIIIDSSDDPVDRLLLQILRKAIRVQGGNAQLVLGGRNR